MSHTELSHIDPESSCAVFDRNKIRTIIEMSSMVRRLQQREGEKKASDKPGGN